MKAKILIILTFYIHQFKMMSLLIHFEIIKLSLFNIMSSNENAILEKIITS